MRQSVEAASLHPEAAQAASALIGTGAATLVGAAAGGGNVSAAAMAGNVDANNRQLHPSERRRIGEMARRQAQDTCREGDAACLQNNTLYWTDMLERAASGRVDDGKAAANNGYYGQVIDAAGRPSSEGSLGASVRFFNDLEAAQRLLNADGGTPILDNRGNPLLGTDGRPQTFFSATAEQRANPYGNALLGQMPTSIIPGKDNRDADRLEYLNARNGSAIPVYPVEETLVGGAVTGRALRAVDVALSGSAVSQATRARVEANVAESGAARASSTFDDPVAGLPARDAAVAPAPRTSGGSANSATSTGITGDVREPQVLELFGGSRAQVPGARNVDPADPNALARDARSMPNVATGSQDRVVVSNPFIPPDAGGNRTPMDYLQEATRVTRPGGEIVINSQWANPYGVSKLPSRDELSAMGLEVVYQGPLPAEFRGMAFVQTSGANIPIDSMRTVILRRCDGPCRP